MGTGWRRKIIYRRWDVRESINNKFPIIKIDIYVLLYLSLWQWIYIYNIGK